jgi:flavin reductase (DIM6/NTAB) family NADH-FMN oxidoreductase RutF
MNSKGMANLAPFSFFTVVSTKPPMVGITILPDKVNQKAKKDTLMNMEETKEFVVNIADISLAEQLVQSSFPYQYGVDEFVECGLTKRPSIDIRVPQINEAPISMECRLHEVTKYGIDGSAFAIGEVIRIHIHNDILINGLKVDQNKLGAFGRMGGPLYSKTTDLFKMHRP